MNEQFVQRIFLYGMTAEIKLRRIELRIDDCFKAVDRAFERAQFTAPEVKQ